jgi:hypothetical protein
MDAKKLGVIIIEGEWKEKWLTYAVEFIYTAYLHAPDDEIPDGEDTYLELPDATGRNLHAVNKEAEDTLYSQGYTHARIVVGSIQWEHRLYGSRRRIAAQIEAAKREEERIAREKLEKERTIRARRNTRRRVRRVRALVVEMANPSPQAIRRFFRA